MKKGGALDNIGQKQGNQQTTQFEERNKGIGKAAPKNDYWQVQKKKASKRKNDQNTHANKHGVEVALIQTQPIKTPGIDLASVEKHVDSDIQNQPLSPNVSPVNYNVVPHSQYPTVIVVDATAVVVRERMESQKKLSNLQDGDPMGWGDLNLEMRSIKLLQPL